MDDLNLRQQIGQAVGHFRRRGRPDCPSAPCPGRWGAGPPVHDVADVNVAALQAHAGDHPFSSQIGGADEGLALHFLLRPRRLPDEEDPGSGDRRRRKPPGVRDGHGSGKGWGSAGAPGRAGRPSGSPGSGRARDFRQERRERRRRRHGRPRRGGGWRRLRRRLGRPRGGLSPRRHLRPAAIGRRASGSHGGAQSRQTPRPERAMRFTPAD